MGTGSPPPVAQPVVSMETPMKSVMTRSLLLIAAALVIPACGKDGGKSSGGGGTTPPPGGPPPAGTLAAPTNIVATPGDRQITLTWTEVLGATGYTIRSATDQGGPYGLVEHNFPGTLFIDDTLDNGTAYYYVITSVNSAGEGPQSAEVTATPVGTTPPPSTQTWTRNPSNPTFFASNNVGDWDRGSVQDASVVQLGASSFAMYYTGGSPGTGAPLQIGRVVSSDGVTWTRSNAAPVLSVGAPGAWDESGVMQPHVLFDGSTYRMWYTGFGTSGGNSIGYATSTDGIAWSKSPAPVLVAGSAGTWDDSGVSAPRVILDGSTYKMWYAGVDATGAPGVQQIGYATSTDGIAWTKQATPVLMPTAGSLDAGGIRDMMVVRNGAGYQAWFTGVSGSPATSRIGFATSTDGITWTKDPSGAPPQAVFDVGTGSAWDSGGVFRPFVLVNGAARRMWYSGLNTTTGATGIGVASSGT